MDLRNLGNSGLRVSVVGLGCNNFGIRTDLEATRLVVHEALDQGITLFDTSDSYGNRGGSEELLGRILGERRKDIVLATKFVQPMADSELMRGASRRYIMTAVEASLRRLRTDWIDLYQIHFPDPLTPIEETLRALDDLVRQGKVRYLGCSNFRAWQVVDAQWTARHLRLNTLVSCQDEYSLFARGIERELIPAMEAHGLGLLPFYPLAAGLLTGKYRKGEPPPKGTRFAEWSIYPNRFRMDDLLPVAEALEDWCRGRGHGLLELAFCWLLARPVVASIIAGATRPEQVAANAGAAGWSLTAEDLAEIDGILAPPA